MSDVIDRSKAFKALYNSLLNPNNSQMLSKIQGGDKAVAGQALQLFGLDPNDKKNIQDLFDLSKAIKSEAQRTQEEQAAKNQADFDKSKAREDYKDAVQGIMALDPKTRLLYTAATAAGEGAHAIGNISKNNGNRLAQAILEASRSHNDTQDRIYGKSIQDKAAALTAADTMRRGENAGNIWDALSNTINKMLGLQQQNDLTVRQMQMIPYDKDMNMSGNYYQMMNQDRKRAFNINR